MTSRTRALLHCTMFCVASLALISGTAVAGNSPVAAPQNLARAGSTMSLNGEWDFALARTTGEKAALAEFYRPGFDQGRFRPTPVPSNWVMQGHEEPHYGRFPKDEEASEGFYIRRFKVPAGWNSQRSLLHFDGVWSSAEIWLNGTLLGRHDSGFTEVSHEISALLKEGADNILAVRVRQVQPDYLLDTNDDWSLPGIYRDVWLESMPKDRWLDRVDIQTQFDDEYRDADLKVRVMVGDMQKRPEPGNFMYPGGQAYDLRLSLFTADGRLVQSSSTSIAGHAGTGRDVGLSLHVERPLHWTAETPNLYRLQVEMVEAGRTVHVRDLKVGFRQISTVGGVLRVNGQAVKLRGVNRHEEHPETGRATTPAQWLEDIKMMKAANINYVRLAHYPPAKGFLDLCDSMGLYVSDEIPMGYGGDALHDPGYAGGVMTRSYATVARDINHPSVIIWSIGNEDPLTSLHMASIRTVKGLDPTRPVLMPWRAENWLPPEIDIQAPHYFDAFKNDELAAGASRPIVTTEFTHAYGTDGFGGLEDRWEALMRHPNGAGGAIWMWADQGIRVRKPGETGAGQGRLAVPLEAFDGIVDAYRQPTRDYWETKAVYAPVRPAIDRLHFTPGQPSIKIPIRNDFDFTDLEQLKMRWRLMADGRELTRGEAALKGVPHAITDIELPTDALSAVMPGTTYYFETSFLRDGAEISIRSVELLSLSASAAPDLASPSAPIVREEDGLTVVEAGSARYSFNPGTGQLASAIGAGRTMLSDLRPTIWRPLNETESWIGTWTGMKDVPDLNVYRASASKWQVERLNNQVAIRSTVDYVVDAQNSFTVTYVYRIAASGRLTLNYAVDPKVQARWLPFVGMRLTLPDATRPVEWLGPGPYDSYPNEKAAGHLGLWSEIPAQDGRRGTKAARWTRIADAQGGAMRIEGPGFIDFGGDAPGQLRLLSSVQGRPSKGRRPEGSELQLNTGTGRPFVGEFALSPEPARPAR